jgi:hypothetical protein
VLPVRYELDCKYYVGASVSHNPMGLHGLFQRHINLFSRYNSLPFHILECQFHFFTSCVLFLAGFRIENKNEWVMRHELAGQRLQLHCGFIETRL